MNRRQARLVRGTSRAILNAVNVRPRTMRYEAIFTPTADDIVRGIRMRNRQSDDAWKLYVAGGALLATILCVAAYILNFLQIAWFGIAIAAIAFSTPMLSELSLKRRAKKIERKEVRYCFTDNGVEFSSDVAQVKHTWDVITKAMVDERGILLCAGKINYVFVPARAFVSGYFPRQELASFLALKLKNA
jgi:hypothetical protein